MVYISRTVDGKVVQTIPLHGFDTLAHHGVVDCSYFREAKTALVTTDANTVWVVNFATNSAVLKTASPGAGSPRL
jgi:hypothetical protein